ncbi:MAG: TonB-dependent receptor [Sphingomonadaceae bacterium]|nr:TonB-dependent receptor [Sphingomonadaceae bacterium]
MWVLDRLSIRGEIEANTTVSYSSSFFWHPDNRLKQPAFAIINVRLSYLPTENLKFSIFGENLTNRRTQLYVREDDRRLHLVQQAALLGRVGRDQVLIPHRLSPLRAGRPDVRLALSFEPATGRFRGAALAKLCGALPTRSGNRAW